MNPARPAPGAYLAVLDDVPEGGAVALDFAAGEARFSLLLTRSGDQAAAFENACPHARLPLERPDGRVVVQEGRFIVCSAHGASFCLRTGAHAGGPGRGGLRPFPIQADGRLIRAG